MAGTLEIREAEEGEEAQAVLVVRCSLPVLGERGGGEFALTRVPPTPPEVVFESETVHPDGRVTKRFTARNTDRGGGTRVCRTHCRTPDGRAYGYSTYVTIDGRSADEVGVNVSGSWHAPDGSDGRYAAELVVPWLGAAQVDLAGGGGHLRGRGWRLTRRPGPGTR